MAPTAAADAQQDAQFDAHAAEAAALLKAMGHPQRLRVLCLLLDGEMTVGALLARTASGQSALSQHLAVLRAQGLVKTRREGQAIHYSLADKPVAGIIAILRDCYCPPGGESSPAR